MQITIPDNLAHSLGGEENEVLTELAVLLYQSERFTLGQAARLVNLPRSAFQGILKRRGIPLHFSEKEIDEEIRAANEFRRP